MEVALKAKRRFTDHPVPGERIISLPNDHPAVLESRTLFPSRVIEHPARILKSGQHSRKIGSHVTKGAWKGMPIFTLTLEERATCPRRCSHWNDCYGNKMHWPHRHRHGEATEHKLGTELEVLADDHPSGFIVRLHVLGDFYSVEYVHLWRTFMYTLPMLRVFGYTARDRYEPIGTALAGMRNTFSSRWWVRWSGEDKRTWLSTGESGIVCPAQTEKTECCGTCALCWTAKKPIRFLSH